MARDGALRIALRRPSTSYIMTLLAMAGKIAPSPSSPLRRSPTQATAASMARWRVRLETTARSRAGHCRRRGRTRTTTLSAAAPSASARASPAARRTVRRCARPWVARLRPLRHQHHQRHDDGAAPIGDLVEMERKPSRQQHDLDRHHRHARHGMTPNSASMMRVNTLARSAPPRARTASRARRM